MKLSVKMPTKLIRAELCDDEGHFCLIGWIANELGLEIQKSSLVGKVIKQLEKKTKIDGDKFHYAMLLNDSTESNEDRLLAFHLECTRLGIEVIKE